jgi:hypothetical protein
VPKRVEDFIEVWEQEFPDLLLYTCWRQLKRYARSFEDVMSWIRPELDKIGVVAPGLVEELKKELE